MICLFFYIFNTHLIKNFFKITNTLYDKMTETVYTSPLQSFQSKEVKESWYEVDVLGRGIAAMVEVNKKLGLSI